MGTPTELTGDGLVLELVLRDDPLDAAQARTPGSRTVVRAEQVLPGGYCTG